MIPLDHRARGNRADHYTEPNSCFSDSSDSLNSLISLNSMKVPLHLEKTPNSAISRSICFVLFFEIFLSVNTTVENVNDIGTLTLMKSYDFSIIGSRLWILWHQFQVYADQRDPGIYYC